jgi:hypothetical protein
MLLGSTKGGAAVLAPSQSRTQFSIWAVMAAPLLIGAHVTGLSAFDTATYSNQEVIAVSQNPLGVQGTRVAGGGLGTPTAKAGGNCGGGPTASGTNATNVWSRPLGKGAFAVILVNIGASDSIVSCDAGCFGAMNAHAEFHERKARRRQDRHSDKQQRGGETTTLKAPVCYTVRNLWSHHDEGYVLSGHLARKVTAGADGGGNAILLVLTPVTEASSCPSPVVPPSLPEIPGPPPYRPPPEFAVRQCDTSRVSQHWTLSAGVTPGDSKTTNVKSADGKNGCWEITACSSAEGAEVGTRYGCKPLPKAGACGNNTCCNGAWAFNRNGTISSAMDGHCLQVRKKTRAFHLPHSASV